MSSAVLVKNYSEVDNEDLVSQFEEDGYALVRGLFTPEEAAEIRDIFMKEAENGPVEGLSDGFFTALDEKDPLKKYPRMMQPHRHSDKAVGPVAMRYMLDQRLHKVLSQFMGEEPIAAQSMFYFKPAGARGQELHQDNFYLRVKPGTCYAAWVAVDDADAENGGMMVVPGSNNLVIVCPEKADAATSFTTHYVPVPEGLKAVPVDMKAGDVLFFNGSVIHGSYPNTSRDRFRRALIFHYLPASSAELSAGYKSLRFDGTRADVAPAEGGGPCGVPQPMGPH